MAVDEHLCQHSAMRPSQWYSMSNMPGTKAMYLLLLAGNGKFQLHHIAAGAVRATCVRFNRQLRLFHSELGLQCRRTRLLYSMLWSEQKSRLCL